MKRIVLIASFIMAAVGLKAQDCDALMLPYFNNDKAQLEEYKGLVPEKLEWHCAYARMAFYESDIVPEGADVIPISKVKSRFSEEHLGKDFVVDLSTLSYYAYNFIDFQLAYATGDKVVCFSTPASAHPYLVLNSLDETNRLATEWWDQKYHSK